MAQNRISILSRTCADVARDRLGEGSPRTSSGRRHPVNCSPSRPKRCALPRPRSGLSRERASSGRWCSAFPHAIVGLTRSTRRRRRPDSDKSAVGRSSDRRVPRDGQVCPTGTQLLDLPFRGRWMARNSPRSARPPVHGTHMFGVTYAIDFINVDVHGRSAARTWRSPAVGGSLRTASSDFGQPIPGSGSWGPVVPHPMTASKTTWPVVPSSRWCPMPSPRLSVSEKDPGAIAGNHVVVALGPTGPFVLLAHLRPGETVRVEPGDRVGNRRPHQRMRQLGQQHPTPTSHVQVTDSIQWSTAKGVPCPLPSKRRLGMGASRVRDRDRRVTPLSSRASPQHAYREFFAAPPPAG